MPNTSPTATDTPNATATDIGDTIVLIFAMRSMPIAQNAADDDAGDAAGEADHHRFAEELREHVALRRADRAPHADLFDALEDRREHDVHDPDAADDERDRRDRAEHDVEDRFRALLLLEQQFRHADLEVGDVVVPALQHAAHDLGHRRDRVRLVDLDDHLVELVIVALLGALLVGLR